MISIDKNFIFVHVGKTGGTAIQSVLAGYCIDKVVYETRRGGEPQLILKNQWRLGKHTPLWAYRERLPAAIYDKMTVAAAQRNPWDRAVSVYFSAHQATPAWDPVRFRATIVRNMHPIAFYLSEIRGGRQARADVLMRYESLQDDFDAFCGRLGIPRQTLPRINVSDRDPDYRVYYDRRLRQFIQARFPRDIALGAYNF